MSTFATERGAARDARVTYEAAGDADGDLCVPCGAAGAETRHRRAVENLSAALAERGLEALAQVVAELGTPPPVLHSLFYMGLTAPEEPRPERGLEPEPTPEKRDEMPERPFTHTALLLALTRLPGFDIPMGDWVAAAPHYRFSSEWVAGQCTQLLHRPETVLGSENWELFQWFASRPWGGLGAYQAFPPAIAFDGGPNYRIPLEVVLAALPPLASAEDRAEAARQVEVNCRGWGFGEAETLRIGGLVRAHLEAAR